MFRLLYKKPTSDRQGAKEKLSSRTPYIFYTMYVRGWDLKLQYHKDIYDKPKVLNSKLHQAHIK